MTSIPASRSALATILTPRSWPSSPGFATTTRIRRAVSLEALTVLLRWPLLVRFDGKPRSDWAGRCAVSGSDGDWRQALLEQVTWAPQTSEPEVNRINWPGYVPRRAVRW